MLTKYFKFLELLKLSNCVKDLWYIFHTMIVVRVEGRRVFYSLAFIYFNVFCIRFKYEASICLVTAALHR